MKPFFKKKDENRIFKRLLVKNYPYFLMKNKTDSLVSLLHYSASVLMYFGRPNTCPINAKNINRTYRITCIVDTQQRRQGEVNESQKSSD